MEPRLSTRTEAHDADLRAQDLVRLAIARSASYDLTSCRDAFYARRQFTKTAVDPSVFPDLDLGIASRAFLALVDRESVVGQLTGVIRVAPATGIGRMLTRPVGGWRREGAPKPCGAFTFDASALAPLTVAAMAAASAEFVRRPDMDATATITQALASALAALTDTALLTPGNTGTVGVKPASILSGLSAAVTNASPAIAAGAALNAISDGAPMRPALVISFINALKSASLLSDLRELGVQVLVSPAAGANVIAIDAARLVIASGDATVAQSTEATLELDMAPAGSTPGVSLFSQNLIGFKAERVIDWMAGPGAAAYSTVS
jgi:hypothetical protein